jgi:ectoine hydroxylase-related dioxygenase (phytanoyl-CoA dioxygenase family)
MGEDREVSVDLYPGEVLIFEGDVVHAGAEYRTQYNTRLHLYLDLPGLERKKGFSWGVLGGFLNK